MSCIGIHLDINLFLSFFLNECILLGKASTVGAGWFHAIIPYFDIIIFCKYRMKVLFVIQRHFICVIVGHFLSIEY